MDHGYAKRPRMDEPAQIEVESVSDVNETDVLQANQSANQPTAQTQTGINLIQGLNFSIPVSVNQNVTSVNAAVGEHVSPKMAKLLQLNFGTDKFIKGQ